MIFVGTDAHYRNSFVHASGADGQVLARGRCGNTLLETARLWAPIERQAAAGREAIRVVMESTTNSRAIRNLLLQYGQQAGLDLTVQVLHARKLRIIAESVTKCDKLDAQVLCDLSRCDLKLPVCYMPDDEEFALREHLRARGDLVRMRTMLKNRVHAVLHRRGILTPTGDLFGKAGRTFLEQVSLDEAGRTILQRFLNTIEQLEAMIAESTASLKELARQPRWAKPAALLQTIPGVGLITALTILAELGDWRRFRSRAAVSNYAGLVPRLRASNEKCWSGGITHQGSSHLRAMLIEAAWMAVEKVPVYRSLFQRVEYKAGKKTAIVAVAREMLEDAFTMLRKDEAFRYVAAPVMPASAASQVGPPVKERIRRSAESSVAG